MAVDVEEQQKLILWLQQLLQQQLQHQREPEGEGEGEQQQQQQQPGAEAKEKYDRSEHCGQLKKQACVLAKQGSRVSSESLN